METSVFCTCQPTGQKIHWQPQKSRIHLFFFFFFNKSSWMIAFGLLKRQNKRVWIAQVMREEQQQGEKELESSLINISAGARREGVVFTLLLVVCSCVCLLLDLSEPPSEYYIVEFVNLCLKQQQLISVKVPALGFVIISYTFLSQKAALHYRLYRILLREGGCFSLNIFTRKCHKELYSYAL